MNKRTLTLISLVIVACAFRPIMTASPTATPVVNQVQQPPESQETKPECKPLKERIKEKIKACKQYINRHKYRLIAVALVTGIIAASALSNHHLNRNDPAPPAHVTYDVPNHCVSCGEELRQENGSQPFACNHNQCLNRDCWPSNTSGNCPRCNGLPTEPVLTHCINAHHCPICWNSGNDGEDSPLTTANIFILPCKHGLHQHCWQRWVNSAAQGVARLEAEVAGNIYYPSCVVCRTPVGTDNQGAPMLPNQGIMGRFLAHCRNTDPRTVAFALDLAINLMRILT